MTKLYLVTQVPRVGYREAFPALVWHIRALSKADALRWFTTYNVGAEAGYPYCKPTAQVLATGGPAIKV